MMIGHIDVKATSRLKRKHIRQQYEVKWVSRRLENSFAMKETTGQSESSESEASDTSMALQTKQD